MIRRWLFDIATWVRLSHTDLAAKERAVEEKEVGGRQ